MKRSEWVHMPHPGHYICGFDCRFHLNTWVGKFIVSTVGEYFPDAPVREIFANIRGVKLEGMGDVRRSDYMEKIGFENIGYDRKYETMVFRSGPFVPNSCCPYRQEKGIDLYMRGYNSAEEAAKGHLEICTDWSTRKIPRDPKEKEKEQEE